MQGRTGRRFLALLPVFLHLAGGPPGLAQDQQADQHILIAPVGEDEAVLYRSTAILTPVEYVGNTHDSREDRNASFVRTDIPRDRRPQGYERRVTLRGLNERRLGTLRTAISATDLTIPLTSVSGLRVGESLEVGDGGNDHNGELMRIASVDAGGNTVTVAERFQAHGASFAAPRAWLAGTAVYHHRRSRPERLPEYMVASGQRPSFKNFRMSWSGWDVPYLAMNLHFPGHDIELNEWEELLVYLRFSRGDGAGRVIEGILPLGADAELSFLHRQPGNPYTVREQNLRRYLGWPENLDDDINGAAEVALVDDASRASRFVQGSEQTFLREILDWIYADDGHDLGRIYRSDERYAAHELAALEAGSSSASEELVRSYQVLVDIAFLDGDDPRIDTERFSIRPSDRLANQPDEPKVSIAASSAPMTEGASATFELALDRAAPAELSASVSVTESGSMLSGAAPASVTFARGETSATLSVPTTNDAFVEADSTVRAALMEGTGYSVGADASASIIVEDDDTATFAVSVAPSAINEGESARLTVELLGGVTFPTDERLVLEVSGSASVEDYRLTPENLTLAAGASSVTAHLSALADAEEEGPEMVTVTVSLGGTSIGSATVTINSVSRDATLASLSLSGIDIGAFWSDTTAYAAVVSHDVTSTSVTASPNAADATVSIAPGPEVSLAEGVNVIAVTVTAADGVTTRTYTVTVTRAAAPPLTASFGPLPEAHDGETPFVFELRFSEPVATSYRTLRDTAFRVTNGAVRAARRVDGRSDLWEIEIAPSSAPALVVVLPATTDCAAAGAVCTAAGKGLSSRLEATIPGGGEARLPVVSVAAVEERLMGPIGAVWVSRTGLTREPLQVQVLITSTDRTVTSERTAQIPAGQRRAKSRLQIGDNLLVEDDITVTWTLQEGENYTVSEEHASASVVLEESEVPEFSVSAEPAEIAEGESAMFTVAITNGVRYPEEQTIDLALSGTASVSDYTGVPAAVALPAKGTAATTATLTALADGEDEGEETVTVTASHGGKELGAATVTITAGEATPLTGRFAQMSRTHDGETVFLFELHFSEEIEISYVTLRDTAFTVAGGAVEKARRLSPPSNLGWEITVRPGTDADVVVVLPETTDCAVAGAICTAGGKMLSERLEATVRGPAAQAAGRGFSLAPGNGRPSGLWSDGATAWVADVEDGLLYAYRLADGSRAPERDVAVAGLPMGLWSDGTTLWVAEFTGGLDAYRLSDGARLPGRDLAVSSSGSPVGLWSDGETVWVADWLGDTVHGYRLADGARVPAQDIRLAGENLLPVGLWSDGVTLWVADWGERVFAYRLSDGSGESARDIALGDGDADPSGLWSDGETLLATGWGGAEIETHPLPEAAAPAASPVRAGAVGWSAGVPPVEDAALREALAAALDSEGFAGLEALEARRRGIRSLAGLDAAVNLKELDLGFNPLEDVAALRKLPALVSLNLDGAAPHLAALGTLTGLERLSVRANALGDLGPLASLRGLVELDVGDNHIEDLRPLGVLSRLAVLRADRNRIADPGPLTSLPRLEVLDLGRNRLRDLRPLAGLAQLRTLRLDGAGVWELTPLAALEGLAALGVAGNAVEDLGVLSGLGGLTRLDLRGNPVEDLAPLRELPALRWIHVGGSPVEDLTPLDPRTDLTVAGHRDRETPRAPGRGRRPPQP